MFDADLEFLLQRWATSRPTRVGRGWVVLPGRLPLKGVQDSVRRFATPETRKDVDEIWLIYTYVSFDLVYILDKF